jgi:hypothetical protein
MIHEHDDDRFDDLNAVAIGGDEFGLDLMVRRIFRVVD